MKFLFIEGCINRSNTFSLSVKNHLGKGYVPILFLLFWWIINGIHMDVFFISLRISEFIFRLLLPSEYYFKNKFKNHISSNWVYNNCFLKLKCSVHFCNLEYLIIHQLQIKIVATFLLFTNDYHKKVLNWIHLHPQHSFSLAS